MSFNKLELAYRDRLALVRRQARPVVGYVGNTVPVELIVAAGCMPVRIAPIDGDTALADPYVESISDPDVRRIFNLFCTGALDALDLLIVPRSTESQHKLYLSLREAVRTGVTTRGPRLWLYDILHTQRDSSHDYGRVRTQALRDALAEIGSACDDEALREAIRQSNAVRTRLGQLHEQRWTQPVSGRQAHVSTGALRFMSPEDGAAALQDLTLDKIAQGPRLLVRGVPLDHDGLHSLVEELGATLVAEDDDWGARAAEPLIDEALPPLQAVFEHCWRDVPCVRIHPADDSWFNAALRRPGLDGVLFYLPKPDDVHGWSYPADKALTAQLGLPSLLIRQDARDAAALRPALQTFIASLHVQQR